MPLCFNYTPLPGALRLQFHRAAPIHAQGLAAEMDVQHK
jgi:hypothetical protein